MPEPASTSLRFAPVIVELIVIPPELSRRMTFSVEFPRATAITLPDPVSLFWTVSRLPLALRKITLLVELMVVPANVIVPAVVLELPMVSPRVREASTTMA